MRINSRLLFIHHVVRLNQDHGPFARISATLPTINLFWLVDLVSHRFSFIAQSHLPAGFPCTNLYNFFFVRSDTIFCMALFLSSALLVIMLLYGCVAHLTVMKKKKRLQLIRNSHIMITRKFIHRS